MNTNPQAKVVLCYGDSNTWGQPDDRNVAGRYPVDVRWTGGLQKLLGDEYYVIEEGLGGRTTDLEHYDPYKSSRNGLHYFTPCLTSHSPVDVVVIMLGTNDLKIQYNRSADTIAAALKQYIDIVRADSPATRLLLMGPAYIDTSAPQFQEYYQETYNDASAAESRRLTQSIAALADAAGVLFFDANSVARVGKDGIHLDEHAQYELAKALVPVIQSA